MRACHVLDKGLGADVARSSEGDSCTVTEPNWSPWRELPASPDTAPWRLTAWSHDLHAQ
jgi:hypothetical protein